MSVWKCRPRRGDVWEYKFPGKPKQRKTIANIHLKYYRREDGSQVRHYGVSFIHAPKGRSIAFRMKWLLKYGRLVERSQKKHKHYCYECGHDELPIKQTSLSYRCNKCNYRNIKLASYWD